MLSQTRHRRGTATQPRVAARRFAPKVESGLPLIDALERLPHPVVALARDYPADHMIEWHRHLRGQLVYASTGVMQVRTPDGIWVVPPLRAVWVPSAVPHEICMATAVGMRTLYVDGTRCAALPARSCLVDVSPLLRELILRLMDKEVARNPGYAAMAELALLEIRGLDNAPLRIALPDDPRARKVCDALLQDPSDGRTCEQWGTHVGASPRTLERLFAKQAHMSFSMWRRHARLLEAMSRLAAGTPVTRIAHELGYDSPSAFTAMFRKALGAPPSEYFRQ
ncbi:MAG TPA: helix-turn-helix transcriptional regulator [Burkholderiales bacterium]|nr:helix-turn-helix transcriptional regulator [Burkholderiales bacterium]